MTELGTGVVFVAFGVLPVTNTILTAWCVSAVLVAFAALLRLKLNRVPSRIQGLSELFVERWLVIAEQTGGTRARRFVPLVGTAFIFILCANWLGALPLQHLKIVNPAGQTVEVFRSAASDINLAVALALVVVFVVEGLELRTFGIRHYLRSLVMPNPLRWLDLLVRPLSLALRLFGSVFAGQILVGTMLIIAPLVLFPFLVLELFVGLVQAVIFSMLTLVFLMLATAHEEEAETDAGRSTPSAKQT